MRKRKLSQKTPQRKKRSQNDLPQQTSDPDHLLVPSDRFGFNLCTHSVAVGSIWATRGRYPSKNSPRIPCIAYGICSMQHMLQAMLLHRFGILICMPPKPHGMKNTVFRECFSEAFRDSFRETFRDLFCAVFSHFHINSFSMRRRRYLLVKCVGSDYTTI